MTHEIVYVQKIAFEMNVCSAFCGVYYRFFCCNGKVAKKAAIANPHAQF